MCWCARTNDSRYPRASARRSSKERGERQVVVGLVHVERGVGTVLLGDRGPPHAPLPDPRDDEGAEEPGRVLPERALRNPDEQQASFVDERFDIALRRGLADDRVDRPPGQERAEVFG